jgi:hypothetical protein
MSKFEQQNYTKRKSIFPMGGNRGCKISLEAPLLPPFESRPDRVGRYLKKYMKNFAFDEFSKGFISTAPGLDFMTGVPIPLRKEDLDHFKGGEGLKLPVISENMAWVMAIDPSFEYVPQYVRFMNHFFKQKLIDGLVKEGRDEAERGDYDHAIIHFRAALILKPDGLHSMYSYARACREKYLAGEDETLIGNFKAESMEYFELLNEVHPRFAQAYYYLGYAYLNMGLYQKAHFTWKEFLKRSTHPKDKKEINERLKQIEQPIAIERGYNEVLAGRWEVGIGILEPFLETNFKTWWPLSYYLGVAYSRTGQNSHAIASFKRTLGINGSHVESMTELADIYAKSNDKENEKKYREKALLITSEGNAASVDQELEITE